MEYLHNTWCPGCANVKLNHNVINENDTKIYEMIFITCILYFLKILCLFSNIYIITSVLILRVIFLCFVSKLF